MKFPPRWPRQTFIEGMFVASLSILCAILTVLQYYWTGQLSRAAQERLNSTLAEQARLLCQDFDSELMAGCSQLLPRGDEVDHRNPQTAHADHLRRWQESRKQPIFSRLAIAVGQGAALKLFLLDQKTASLIPSTWPPDWSALRTNLQRQISSGETAAPFRDPSGVLREFPVYGGPTGRPDAGEREWMIFELDLDYLQETWMPNLIATYLSPDHRSRDDVIITTTEPAPRMIFSTSGIDNTGGSAISLPMNPVTRRSRNVDGGNACFWTFRAWPRTRDLESAMSLARWRNLGLACIPNVLMLVAGIALVRYTRRSRLLAERQMNFVANVSHELRTPLTVIRGAGHNLLRGIVHEQRQVDQYLRLIIQHADQLTGMIEQLLELADARKKAVATEAYELVNVAELLDTSIATTLSDTQAAGCEIHATILRNLPQVYGDATALKRVFQNLFTNAAKYGASGGWIGVETTCRYDGPRTWLEVTVADRGPGIPEHEQANIFEAFYRGSDAQSQQIRGTGLGLSLVREIVQAHGGHVTVRSQPWEGTVFTVQLPAIETGRTRRLSAAGTKRTEQIFP